MNCAAVTAFLPKFVGFPSLRGLYSSIVPLRRAPVPERRAPVRRGSRPKPPRMGAGAFGPLPKWPFDARSCRGHAWVRRPMDAVVLQACEGAWDLAQLPYRRSTDPPDGNSGPGRATRPRAQERGARPRCGPRVRWVRLPRREGRQTTVSCLRRRRSHRRRPRRRTTRLRRTSRCCRTSRRTSRSRPRRPPAAAVSAAGRTRGRPRPATRRPRGTAPAHSGHQRRDQDDCEHRQDDADNHGVTLLSFPPKRPPVGASLLREQGMPGPRTPQSRVEELQSFGGG